ncbi:MAG: DUF3108 domain-containing protein, partial [Bdellovibrionales bacterium]|nr:DUF3108 domain-containing protein [Bdellovibrionales bacterium]
MTRTFFKSLTCLFFAATLALHSAAARASFENASLRFEIEEPKKLGLTYDVYAGGFKALSALLDMDLDPKAYDLSLKAKTQGTIGSLFPWEATYATSGLAKNGSPVPTMHTSRSSWKKDEKVTEMQFSPKGDVLKTTTHENNQTKVKKDFDPALTTDAVDMLTGALQMFQHTGQTSKCEGSFPVFDGKRRFNITLHDDGVETLAKSKYSAYRGDTLRCTLKVEPVAGFKKDDAKRGWMAVQNHTEARKKPPTIWMAQLEENGPRVPVRMEIASSYGSVVAHLTGV